MNDARATLTLLRAHAPIALPMLAKSGYYSPEEGAHCPNFDWELVEHDIDGAPLVSLTSNFVENGEFDIEPALRELNIPYQRTNDAAEPNRSPLQAVAGEEQFFVDAAHQPILLMDYGHRTPVLHKALADALEQGAEAVMALVKDADHGVAETMPWAQQWTLVQAVAGGARFAPNDFNFVPLLVNKKAIGVDPDHQQALADYIEDHIASFGGLPVDLLLGDEHGDIVLGWHEMLSLFPHKQRAQWHKAVAEYDQTNKERTL